MKNVVRYNMATTRRFVSHDGFIEHGALWETKRQVVWYHRQDASSMSSDITSGEAAYKKVLVTWVGTLLLVPF